MVTVLDTEMPSADDGDAAATAAGDS